MVIGSSEKGRKFDLIDCENFKGQFHANYEFICVELYMTTELVLTGIMKLNPYIMKVPN